MRVWTSHDTQRRSEIHLHLRASEWERSARSPSHLPITRSYTTPSYADDVRRELRIAQALLRPYTRAARVLAMATPCTSPARIGPLSPPKERLRSRARTLLRVADPSTLLRFPGIAHKHDWEECVLASYRQVGHKNKRRGEKESGDSRPPRSKERGSHSPAPQLPETSKVEDRPPLPALPAFLVLEAPTPGSQYCHPSRTRTYTPRIPL